MADSTIDIRVRFSEIATDHVYYANYFGWFEACLGEQRRVWLMPSIDSTGRQTMVTESFCRYITPARFDDVLRVESNLAAAAPKRIMFEHTVNRGDELLACGRTTHVLLQPDASGLQVFPDRILELADRRVERVDVLDKPESYPPPADAAKVSELRTPVRYKETDAAGIVYYSNYYVYFEIGRTELLRAAGLSFADLTAMGIGLPVTRAYCSYVVPISYGDSIIMKTWIAQVKKVRATFGCELYRASDGQRMASGFTTHGCIGADGKPAPLPEAIAKLAAS